MKRAERRRLIEKLQRRAMLLAVRKDFCATAADRRGSELDRVTGELESIKRQLAMLGDTSDKLRVSDHARVRYMERVHGLDMAEIDAEILGGRSIEQLRDGRYKIDGHSIRVRDNVVVTVVKKDRRPKRKRPREQD